MYLFIFIHLRPALLWPLISGPSWPPKRGANSFESVVWRQENVTEIHVRKESTLL